MKIDLSKLIAICTVVSLGVAGATFGVKKIIEVNDFIRMAKKNQRRVEVLEEITTQEHPEYWQKLFPLREEDR